MDANRFNSEVRPHVPEVPIGKQGVAFDRLDLDAWWEEYKSKNARPIRKKPVLQPSPFASVARRENTHYSSLRARGGTLDSSQWKSHCRRLYQLPITA